MANYFVFGPVAQCPQCNDQIVLCACTMLIKSGRLDPKHLPLVYGYRAFGYEENR